MLITEITIFSTIGDREMILNYELFNWIHRQKAWINIENDAIYTIIYAIKSCSQITSIINSILIQIFKLSNNFLLIPFLLHSFPRNKYIHYDIISIHRSNFWKWDGNFNKINVHTFFHCNIQWKNSSVFWRDL